MWSDDIDRDFFPSDFEEQTIEDEFEHYIKTEGQYDSNYPEGKFIDDVINEGLLDDYMNYKFDLRLPIGFMNQFKSRILDVYVHEIQDYIDNALNDILSNNVDLDRFSYLLDFFTVWRNIPAVIDNVKLLEVLDDQKFTIGEEDNIEKYEKLLYDSIDNTAKLYSDKIHEEIYDREILTNYLNIYTIINGLLPYFLDDFDMFEDILTKYFTIISEYLIDLLALDASNYINKNNRELVVDKTFDMNIDSLRLLYKYFDQNFINIMIDRLGYDESVRKYVNYTFNKLIESFDNAAVKSPFEADYRTKIFE